MHLIDQKDDPAVLLLGRLPQRDQQVGQVFVELAAVGEARRRVYVEARGQRAVWIHRELKRLQDGCRPGGPVLPLGPWRELEKCSADELAHSSAELRALGDLGLDRGPV